MCMTGNGVAQAVRGYVFHLQSTIARNNRNRGNRRPLFDVDRVHAALRGDRIDDDDAESMPGIVLEEEIECTKA